MPQPYVSLVLPTYNEGANLEGVLARVDAVLAGAGASYEIIVVDDDSPDRIWELAERLARERFTCLRVVRRVGERGLATAVVRGWEVAGGEILAVMDADGQHPEAVLLQLVERIAAGADIAVASRHVAGGGVSEWSALRRVLSRGAQAVALLVVPSVAARVSDPLSGFFALRREVISGCTLRPLGYKILLEVLGCGRYQNVAEVGYVFLERQGGASKVTLRLYGEYLQQLVRLGRRTGELRRFVRFGVVGGSGVFVNLVALWGLRELGGLPLWLASAGAIETAIVSNFWLNERWTFRREAELAPGIADRLLRFVRFNGICAFGALLNLACLVALTTLLHWPYLMAQLVGIALAMGWNYTLNAIWNWRVRPGRSARTVWQQSAAVPTGTRARPLR